MNGASSSRRRRNRFSTAPRELVSPSYFVAVAAGEIERDPMAYPAFGPVPRAEDYADRRAAYDLGFGQGFDCELGGRIERPTPPRGMARALLPRFAIGVLDGAECVQRARAAQGTGTSKDDFDPLADLIVDLM